MRTGSRYPVQDRFNNIDHRGCNSGGETGLLVALQLLTSIGDVSGKAEKACGVVRQSVSVSCIYNVVATGRETGDKVHFQ